MPDLGSVATWVLRAIKDGLSATRGLQAYRESGGRIRTQTWYRAFGEVRRSIEDWEGEGLRPLHRRPTGDEILPWTQVSGTGYIQHVDILIRDRTTGDVTTIPYSLRTDRLRSRRAVIDEAVDLYDGYAEDYGQEVLGGIYAATFALGGGGV